MLDAHGYGGQAGASARIENYLGFPTGITGKALTGRAFVQAEKFGAEIIFPAAVTELVCLGPAGPYRLELADGGAVTARTVVIASGARYRRPAIPRHRALRGARGLVLGLADRGAALRRRRGGAGRRRQLGRPGGGLPRRRTRAQVNLLIRGRDLGRSMSRYLVERIAATPNIELLDRDRDHRARRRPGAAPRGPDLALPARPARRETRPIRNLFLFVGADPETSWVRPCALKLDRAGFVLTGAAVPGRGAGQAAARGEPARASSRSATCGRARSSGSAARSARARRWWRRSTRALAAADAA